MLKGENLIKALEESHMRCESYGMDVHQLYSRTILNEVQLQKRFQKSRNLIITASPYMEQLINFMQESNFYALLTDGEGCILNAIGNEAILSEAFSMKMVPGAFMDEKNIGTNAMSVVISYKQPVQISGNHHFIEAYHKWTCSAAPIMNSRDELIGVLNLTGYNEDVHPHTLGMVIAASNAITEMIKTKEHDKLQNINQKHLKTIFESIPAAIITSDINGKIKLCNKKALEMFGNKISDMKKIINDWEKVKNDIYLGKSISQVVNILTLRNDFFCRLSASTIYNSEEDSIEIVYVFEQTSKSKNKDNNSAYYTFDKIIGEDENFLKIIHYAKKISNSKSTILIMGESGTGKEVFAQSIHNNSSRMDGPFVAINCGAIPRQLIESELFGYEEGAFTGAKKGGNIGKFELANGGTIMLDEIGEMPLDMQTKLLRVVQEGVITRIGSSASIPVDVRIIAATNKDLKKEVELGRFRKDLFYRLNVLPIYLPPLRERKGDILLLTDYYIRNICERLHKKPIEIPEEYLKKMTGYSWPGNIRELENFIELIINTETIPSNYLNDGNADNEILLDLNEETLKLDYAEEMHIKKVLKSCQGNISHAAQALGIRRNTLYSKIKKYNIDIEYEKTEK